MQHFRITISSEAAADELNQVIVAKHANRAIEQATKLWEAKTGKGREHITSVLAYKEQPMVEGSDNKQLAA